MANNPGTLIISTIRPAGAGDAYPTAFANELKGGHHTISTFAELSGISSLRKEDGMLVTTVDTLQTYVLSGDQAFEIAGGGAEFSYTNENPMPQALGGLSIGTSFSATSLQELFDNLLYPYTVPLISFSSSPGSGTYEFGSTIPSVNFTINVTKKSLPITSVRLERGSTAIFTDNSPSSNGGEFTYTETESVTSTTSFRAFASDGTTTVQTGTVTHTFVYPFYVGAVSTASPTESDIEGLTKQVKTKSNTTTTYTISNQRFVIAYPSSHGALASVLDGNGFENLTNFTQTTVAITGLDGTAQNYRVYTYNNPVTVSNFTIQYKF